MKVLEKMSEHKTSNGGGVGFFDLLTVTLIALKLMGYIDWPWVWVLAPTWGLWVLVALVVLVLLLMD